MQFDPARLLQELGDFARSSASAVGVLLFTLGLFFISRGGYLMWRGREGRGAHDDVPIAAVLANLGSGAALLQLNATVSNTRRTLGGFGSEVRTAMQYVAINPAGGSQVYQLALATALSWVALIGICAIVRGLLKWRELAAGANRGAGEDLAWSGLWHVLGGGVCVNVGLG